MVVRRVGPHVVRSVAREVSDEEPCESLSDARQGAGSIPVQTSPSSRRGESWSEDAHRQRAHETDGQRDVGALLVMYVDFCLVD